MAVTLDGCELALHDFRVSPQPATAAQLLSYAREAFENGELNEHQFDAYLAHVNEYLWQGGSVRHDG